MQLAKLGNGPEIFFTLQGEGVSTGVPAIFVRSSRCNLFCHWCDTDHTWNFQGTSHPHENDSRPDYQKFQKSDVIIDTPISEIAAAIEKFPCQRVILTGGEPLIHQADWLALIQLLRQRSPAYQFEMETNGTLAPNDEILAAIDQFNVSPKLENSRVPRALRIKPEVLTRLIDSQKAWFKFVVRDELDLAEVHQLVQQLEIPTARVILMPEGRTSAQLDQRAAWLAEQARDAGFRFSDRLHVRLWGDKRGV